MFNKNARITTTTNSNNTVMTKTVRRDDACLHAEITSKRNGHGSTRLFLKASDGNYLALDGLETRTIYRLLQTHFEKTGKTF